uniref:Vesicle transport protein n=1 Tax=Pyramimonas obovata TaxID=1411642 RepID=A0A7S0QW90_9CHLO|mmetsp:Transcript_17696/g.38603  ORF Transcript_17696/g.38603 Transcript_17696/m.38603 type:complete len:236 (+) Transcript_17696:229-936(+)
MFTNLLGNTVAPEEEVEVPLADRVKNFFGIKKPPSQTQQLVSDIRSTLEPSPETQGMFSGMMSSMRQSATSFRQSVGLEDPVGEQSLMSEIDQATTLSYGQRFHGFVISLGLGILCSGLSFLFYFNTTVFALFYTIGNVMALSSSAFFWGPLAYSKMMFKKGRWMSTLAMVVMMFLTLFVVFYSGSGILVMLCIFLQSSCLFWYTISYIPFAQRCFKGLAKKCFGGLAEEVTDGW